MDSKTDGQCFNHDVRNDRLPTWRSLPWYTRTATNKQHVEEDVEKVIEYSRNNTMRSVTQQCGLSYISTIRFPGSAGLDNFLEFPVQKSGSTYSILTKSFGSLFLTERHISDSIRLFFVRAGDTVLGLNSIASNNLCRRCTSSKR